MTNTFERRIGDSRTSAFTLPSPRKMPQQQEQQQQGQSSCEAGAGEQPSTASSTTPLRSSSYEEFDNHNKGNNNSSRHNQSPSLPWLVEYMGSSFFRAPELVLDQLCSCSSTVDHTSSAVYDISHANTLNSTTTSSSIFSNNSNSISHYKTNNSKNNKKTTTYFDDTILRSEPKVDRSPTKISPTRWEALRSVVASHGDYTIQDYCDFYEKAVESIPSEEKDDFNGIANADTSETNNMDARYPIMDNLAKSMSDESNDEDEEDADVVMEDSNSLRDDVPLSPIASGVGVDIRPSKSHSHSGRDLNTYHSFDKYKENTSRFLSSSRQGLETPTTHANAAPPLSLPTTRLPDRRRSRQATFQLSPRTLGFQRQTSNSNTNSNNPPSPAHSQADTHTTISLSQSFAREFDEDSDDVVTRSRSLLEDGRNIFLATEPLNFVNHNSDPSRSPFRRLRPRTTLSDNDNETNNNDMIDANGHEDEKKEDLENTPSTPPRRISRKRANESTNDDAYRCLVRMSPDNYKHGKSNEIDIGIGENQENSNNNSDYCWWDNVGMKFPISPTEQSHLSSASSSLLLPLHPHQRIIAPLLDDFEGAAVNADHSGYSCFRQEPQRRRIFVPDF